MSSSSDVRDVLELPKWGSAPPPQGSKPPAKKFKGDSKKLDGMQRELYSLLGENTPPIAVTDNKFRDKPNWRQKATPWVWTPFKPGGRDDDLTLGHWVRGVVHGNEDEEYAFSKFNVKVEVPELQREDYKVFKEPGWTFDETQYLFDLCRDYDLRWMIVHDRYDYPDEKRKQEEQNEKEETEAETAELAKATAAAAVDEDEVMANTTEETEDSNKTDSTTNNNKAESEEQQKQQQNADKKDVKKQSKRRKSKKDDPKTGRGIDDLKDRFYGVYKALLKHRQEKGESLTPAEEDLIKQMNFSKDSERRRKEHLERLLSRSPAEIAEEEALVMESRKLEAAAERMLNERQELLRLLDAPTVSSSISQYQSSQGLAQLTNNLLSDKSKRRKEVTATAGQVTGPLSSSSNVQKLSQSNSSANNKKSNNNAPTAGSSSSPVVQAAVQKKLSVKEEAAYGITYHDKLTSGVHLRSTKINTSKPAVQTKINNVMTELGLPTRPVMPTGKVCAKFESIQQSIGVLLEAKKQADKLDAEIKVLRGSSATATATAAPATTPTVKAETNDEKKEETSADADAGDGTKTESEDK